MKIDFPSVKKNTKSAREKEKTHPWKKNEKKSVRENRKVPVKKQKSDQKCPWKPKSVREKSEKSVRERGVAFREKSRKKAKNGFHGHFWFSRGKKKRCHRQSVTLKNFESQKRAILNCAFEI